MGDLNRNYGFVLVAIGDTAGARALFEEVLPMDGVHRANGLRSLALLDMYRGRIGDGIEKLREAVGLTVSLQEPLSEYRNRLYLASLHDIEGQSEPASRERALARGIAEDIAPASNWLLILGQQYARAGDLDGAAVVLALIETQVDASSPETNRADRLQMRGELALARGDTAAAESALETANGLWSNPARLESLAFAAYRQGRWEEAERLLREYLEHPLLGYEQQACWIRSLHRMGRVLEERGDTAGAIDHYRRFLALWRDGDAELPEKLQVEERLAGLGERRSDGG
jgi:tetratricopeptide (TPR) repeat protein